MARPQQRDSILSELSYLELLTLVDRILRHRDKQWRGASLLADQLDVLWADLVDTARSYSGKQRETEINKCIADFEKSVHRHRPKSGPDFTLPHQVVQAESAFDRMLNRRKKLGRERPSRRAFEAVCKRLWRNVLKRQDSPPGWVLDKISNSWSPRSMAIQLVAAGGGDNALERRMNRLRNDPTHHISFARYAYGPLLRRMANNKLSLDKAEFILTAAP